jgi:O-antigen/teichoic acid export membrane protein
LRALHRGRASILRNLGVLTVAQAATMILNVVALVHIARTVGNFWFGVIQLGVAFSSYALIVGEWGMYALGVREVARLDTRAAVRAYADTHVGLMTVLGLATMLGACAVLPLFSFYRHDPVIFLLYVATVVPMFLSLDWVGLGLERMVWIGLAKILRSLIYSLAILLLLGGLAGIAGWSAARWVPLLFLGAYLIATAATWVAAFGWLGGPVWPRLGPWSEWRRRLAAAGPIGAANLTLRVLLNVDVLLLGLLVSPAEVGDYAAAAKVVFVLVVAVEVIWRALLPRLARLWQESPERFRQRLTFYLGLVVVGFLPLAVGGALLGDRLMGRLYGEEYPGAGLVARILSVSYVLLALGQFLGNALLASDRQRAYFPPLLIGALVAAAAVAGLGGIYGCTGAAAGMLAAHLTLLIATVRVSRDLVGRALRRPLAAAGLGAAALVLLLALTPRWPLLTLIPLGAAAYALVVVPLVWPWLRRERAL